MRKWIGLFVGFLFFASMAKGQILVDTNVVNRGAFNIGPTLSFSKVFYETEEPNSITVKRKTLGLGVITRLDSNIGLLFQLGYTFDANIEEISDFEGTGYMAGAGLNFLFYRGSRVAFIGYGLLNYVSDSYKKKSMTMEMEVTDIHLGATLLFYATHNLGIYGGLDLVPYSDGTIGKKIKTNLKRERMVNLKLGLEIMPAKMNVRPELTLIGEKTVTIGATFAF